jgi:hypothetical protein
MSPKVIPKTAQLVPLEEVAYQMGGGTIETAVARLHLAGQTATADWQGRPAVTVQVAAELVAGYEQETASLLAKQAAYQQYVAAHQEARREAGLAAYRAGEQRAHQAELRAIDSDYAGVTGSSRSLRAGTPYTRGVAVAERQKALQAFDANHGPIRPLEEWEE